MAPPRRFLGVRVGEWGSFRVLRESFERCVYGTQRIFKAGQSVPVVIEGVEFGRTAFADNQPRDPSGARQAAGGNGA